MKRIILILLAMTAASTAYSQKTPEDQIREKDMKIHDKVITIDTHADINVRNFTGTRNYTMDVESQVTIPKMKEGGLDVAWFIVYTGQDELTPNEIGRAHV